MARGIGRRRAGGSRAVIRPRRTAPRRGPFTLAIDVGGSGLKAMVLDAAGRPVNEPARVATPSPATPRAVLAALAGIVAAQPRFDRVSVGFPGVVRDGVALTAPNLHRRFAGLDVAGAVARVAGRPTRVGNDADVQGLAVIRGRGVEMVLTLGTGMGSALYLDGRLVPNLELAHHVFRGGGTYEEYVGNAALAEIGTRRWRRRVREVVEHLAPVFNYDRLYLGGGNARLLDRERDGLPRDVELVSNDAGMLGGIALWR